MPNIQFNYRYRDGANYKKHGVVIFNNPVHINIKQLETLIRSKLIDGTWFYAHQWQIPNLYFETRNPETEPTWHEFESIEYTDEPANSPIQLMQFIATIESINNTIW